MLTCLRLTHPSPPQEPNETHMFFSGKMPPGMQNSAACAQPLQKNVPATARTILKELTYPSK